MANRCANRSSLRLHMTTGLHTGMHTGLKTQPSKHCLRIWPRPLESLVIRNVYDAVITVAAACRWKMLSSNSITVTVRLRASWGHSFSLGLGQWAHGAQVKLPTPVLHCQQCRYSTPPRFHIHRLSCTRRETVSYTHLTLPTIYSV